MFCTQRVMEPFRSLLKTKGATFEWTDDMEQAFKKSKEVIIEGGEGRGEDV